MQKLFFSICFTAFVLTAGAQVSGNLKKAYAFYTVSVPGMQMTDENGNPVPPKLDIARFIYFEWCGKTKPEIENVLYNDKALSATLTAIEGNTVIPGDDPGNNAPYKITAKKGNTLWKIELRPLAGNDMPEQDCRHISIISKAKGKSFTFKLLKESQLMTIPRY